MLVQRKRKALVLTNCINGELGNVCTYKYLCVDIDAHPSFDKCMEVTWNRLYARCLEASFQGIIHAQLKVLHLKMLKFVGIPLVCNDQHRDSLYI